MAFRQSGSMVIKSFADGDTEALANRRLSRRWPREVQVAALRKLRMLEAAERLEDMRVPPGNRLEKLSGSRAGQYSIRVNDQWRICFNWWEGEAHDVELCDCH